ncbi:MAG: chorismate synthase [Candidatus Lokiarchaeota archaeon]|nr:chorismate synthase [Candidatus Lokiarchaeota archaeon]
MGDNTIGTRFKITSFGESHGKVVGIVIDGTPAGLELDINFLLSELEKRKTSQSSLTTSREEPDIPEILSGMLDGKTTGAPICLIIHNKDVDSSKYEKYKDFLRPSQIDYSLLKKQGGFGDFRGSGRFSGRLTAGFVMAGAIAKQVLQKYGISVFSYTKRIGTISDETVYDVRNLYNLFELRENSLVRALDHELSKKMENSIKKVKLEKDSLGGVIKCVVSGLPEGVGGPMFNSIESNLAKAIFSIPAVKGIEFGAGFKATTMKGSEHNDPWVVKDGKITTLKNDSGGIIGGISIGTPIEFNVGFKPTPTIGKLQKTVRLSTMEPVEMAFSGRHDPCIVPRAVVVVEAMTAIVILDFLLLEGKIPTVLKP